MVCEIKYCIGLLLVRPCSLFCWIKLYFFHSSKFFKNVFFQLLLFSLAPVLIHPSFLRMYFFQLLLFSLAPVPVLPYLLCWRESRVTPMLTSLCSQSQPNKNNHLQALPQYFCCRSLVSLEPIHFTHQHILWNIKALRSFHIIFHDCY
jgi:hypothetical protein